VDERCAFWKVLAEEAVDIFDGSFLPTGVTVSVVERAVESLFEEVVIHELGTAVGGDGVDFKAAQEAGADAHDFFAPLSLEEACDDVAGFALEQDEERTLASDSFDEVHFPVSVAQPSSDVICPGVDATD
jgi:hypothetical protein